MRRLLTLPLLLGLLVLTTFVSAQLLRQQLGVEVSVVAVREWVESLGWRGPAAFTGLVALRFFFLLPSAVLLTAGGLLFGPLLGTLLGGVGIVVSATLGYLLARGIGGDWLRRRLVEHTGHRRVLEGAGPLLVGLATAHPFGPMTAFHVAAGLSTLPLVAFLLAVTIGGPIRAAMLSIVGSVLLEPASWEFVVATLALLAVTLAPLAHPTVRRRILPGRGGG